MKIIQHDHTTLHGIRLLEGVVDCLLQAGTELPPIIAALAEVSVRTARRDPRDAAEHLDALAAILSAAAVDTPAKPANDLHQNPLLQGS